MKKWQHAEKKDTKLFGTTAQRGSGNQDHFPTDSFSTKFAVETKQTEKESYSVTKKTWDKLCEETAVLEIKDNTNKIPLLSLHIGETHLVVMSYDDFQKMSEESWMYEDLLN